MEDQGIYKKTLLTVAAMLGAWVVIVGSLTLVTVLVVHHAAPDEGGVNVDAPNAQGAAAGHPEPKEAPPKDGKNRLMKSATQI